jgi:hypothetical protein
VTKVILSIFLLRYRKAIAGTVSECIRSKYIDGVPAWGSGAPVLAYDDLLPPPRIEIMDLVTYKGQAQDPILLAMSEDFGLHRVRLIIRDGEGNLLERGEMSLCLGHAGIWLYFAKTSVPPGTTVAVHVIAIDRLGGLAAWRQDKLIE